MTQPKTIEYFYAAHSAYAYLGAWELKRIADDAGAQVIHRPFDFAPVMAAAGGKGFRERSKAHLSYFFGREMVRWAEWRGLPMIRHRPTYHDNPLALANGAIIAAGDGAGPLSRAILQAHWRDDADLADVGTVRRLAEEVGLDGAALIEAAQGADVQARHKANTDEAMRRSVFGSPTYFVDGDMFYGQDRLFMVERALQTPFDA
ncbi:MAG: 2-hydroxychromene-2-carboxylate isomerase [Sulfitobacter sp.]|nr:2-hydroxychromene-2-carboxylate isomerase [Sulfitobacter sp.]